MSLLCYNGYAYDSPLFYATRNEANISESAFFYYCSEETKTLKSIQKSKNKPYSTTLRKKNATINAVQSQNNFKNDNIDKEIDDIMNKSMKSTEE